MKSDRVMQKFGHGSEFEDGFCYLFQHFDSRGGSILVIAHSLAKAAASYNQSCFGIEPDDPGMGDPAGADFDGMYSVLVCDEAIDEGTLAQGFDAMNLYEARKLLSRHKVRNGEWGEWTEEDVIVLWIDRDAEDDKYDEDGNVVLRNPPIFETHEGKFSTTEYKVDDREDYFRFEEDAFGLLMQRA